MSMTRDDIRLAIAIERRIRDDAEAEAAYLAEHFDH